MSDNPTTPDKSGDTGRTSPAMAGVPHTEASAATKVSQIEVEPSPASTYGVSAVGNSVPATPQDIEAPAILSRALRSSGSTEQGIIASGGTTGSGIASLTGHGVLVKYTASGSQSGNSSGSSPNANRTRDIREAITWRGDDSNDGDANDVTRRSVERTPTVINGVVVTRDNAQALLPPAACVFVANLASPRTDEQLECSVDRVFERFGTVYVKIRRDTRGMPYAFCQYENVSDSDIAIEQGRGISIDGRQCRTERAKARRALYLSRITGGHISEEEANEVLDGFGPLEKIWIATPTDKEMYRLPEGVFVMWEFFQGARDAYNAFKDHPKYRLDEPALPAELRNRASRTNLSPLSRVQLHESPQLRMTRSPDRISLYVGNLPMAVTQGQIYGLFQAYGNVQGIEIISKRVHNANGVCVFAFVEMGSEEEVRRVVTHEFTLEGLRLRVEVKNSPGHIAQRTSHMVSTGSPRRRNETASPEAMGGNVNSALAMSRALAVGVHPNLVSYIFSGVNGGSAFNHAAAITAQPSMAPPQVAPMYAQVPYDAAYYNQFGAYGSSARNTEGEASTSHYQYPPNPPYNYTMPTYSNNDTDGANQGGPLRDLQ